MDYTNIAVQVGAIYGAVQIVAQGAIQLQKVFVKNPEKTIFFKVAKWLIAGPSRWLDPSGNP